MIQHSGISVWRKCTVISKTEVEKARNCSTFVTGSDERDVRKEMTTLGIKMKTETLLTNSGAGESREYGISSSEKI